MNLKNFTLAFFLVLAGVCHGQDFTIKTSNVVSGFNFSIQIVNGPATSVTVDWGNGQTSTETVSGLEKLFSVPAGLVGTAATITIDGGGNVEIINFTDETKIDEFIVNTTNTKFWSLLINGSGLTVLDVAKASALTKLVAPLNNLTSVNLTNNVLLEELKLNGNSALETVTAPSTLANLTLLNLNNTKVTNASVQGILAAAPNLETVTINNSGLTSINLLNNTKVTDLQLQDNDISGSLNLSLCTVLQQVLANNNAITSVLVNSTALTYINLGNNKVSTLNVSAAPNLANLYCNNNELESLDLTGSTGLENVQLRKNKLSSLTFDPALESLNSLDISNNKFDFYTWPQIKVTGSYLYSGQEPFVISVKADDLFSIDMSKFMNPFPAGSIVPGTAEKTSTVTWYGTWGGQEEKLDNTLGDFTYNEITKIYAFVDLTTPEVGFDNNFVYAKIQNAAFPSATFTTIKVELGEAPTGIGSGSEEHSECYYIATGNEVVYNVKDARNIRVINLSGQVVYNKNLNADEGRVSLNDLAKGIYILQLQSAKTTVQRKIVKR